MDGISARKKAVQESTPSAAQSMHGLTLFRGLAILQIAFLHASHALFLRGLPGPSRDDDPIFISIDIGFHGSTIYFAMISGFLYQHISPDGRTSSICAADWSGWQFLIAS